MSKKNFKSELNPALQFISSPAKKENQERDKQNYAPEKQSQLYIETKSKRLQLLIKPSLHSELKAMAARKETSLNDLIHTILEQAANNK